MSNTAPRAQGSACTGVSMRTGWIASLAGLLLSAGTLAAQVEPLQDEKPEPGKLEKKLRKPEKTSPADDEPPSSSKDAPARVGFDFELPRSSWLPWPDDGHWWTSAEFLLLWTKDPRRLPALLRGPVVPGTEEDPGDPLGQVLGIDKIDYREFASLRLSAGYWFDPDRCFGWENSLLIMGKRSLGFREDQFAQLSRPFFNLATRGESVITVAAPNIAAGGFAFSTTSRTWGMETNLVRNLFYEPILHHVRVDWLCGLRYMDLAEDFRAERATAYNPDLTANPQFLAFQSNRIFESESIRAHNSFYGAHTGVSAKIFGEYLVLEVKGKIGLGLNQQRLTYRGEQLRIRADGTRTTSPGALFVLPSNQGKHRRAQFNYMPEFGANLGIPLNNHIGVYLGYTVLYWSKVARPSDQIDRVVDASQIPNLQPPIPAATGIGRPSVPFTQTHWYLQGISLGIEFSW